MRISPPARRSKTSHDIDGFRIVIPARRNVFALLFLTAWLVGWAFGEVTVTRQLLFGKTEGGRLFLLAWLAIWTVGGAWAIYTWLWNAVGKEIVLLGSGTLALKRDILGLGRLREFDLAHVSNLRASAALSADTFGWGAGNRFCGIGSGIVAFDYGARTFRFGAALDEAEGSQLVSELVRRHTFGAGGGTTTACT